MCDFIKDGQLIIQKQIENTIKNGKAQCVISGNYEISSDANVLPKGNIVDYPDYEMRSFMLDCGRKFIPISFLHEYVDFMAYYKMNTFHIHLNDNAFKQYFNHDWAKTPSGFRLESDLFPGLTSRDGYYTKEEFIELQKHAERVGVEIIPEIDVPAHSLAFGSCSEMSSS